MNTKVTDAGDPFFVGWVIQSGLKTIKTGSSFWNLPIFYPYPNTMAFSDHSLTLAIQALPISFFTNNPIFLINYTQIISFFLAGLFAYYLAYFYTRNRKASIVAGIIFGFSPYHVGAMGHLQIISYQYIPLTILFFEKFLKSSKLKDCLLFVLAFLLNAFVSIYLLGFILVPLTIIFLFRIIKSKGLLNKKFIINSIIGGIIAIVCLLPLYLPYLSVSSDFNTVRDISEVMFFGATFGNYLVAPPNHIYWGQFSQQKINANPANYWSERTLFFGFITIIFAFLGLWIFKKVKNKQGTINLIKSIKFDFNRNTLIYLLIILSGFALSFGPLIIYKGIKIPLPEYILYRYLFIFKAIRAPTRISIITLLGLAILVAIFFDKIFRAIKGKYKYVIVIVLLGIVGFEQLSIPIGMTNAPSINIELAQWSNDHLPKDKVAFHYPTYYELYYLRATQYDDRPIFNGYSGIIPESTRRMMDLMVGDQFKKYFFDNLKILADLNVSYFILHKDLSIEKIGENNYMDLVSMISKDNRLVPLKTINGDTIYDITIFKNSSLYSTVTTKDLIVNKTNITLKHKNSSDQIWVSNGLQYYNIQIDFIKDNKVYRSTNRKIYQTLFLFPGDDFQTSFDVSITPLDSFDRIEAHLI